MFDSALAGIIMSGAFLYGSFAIAAKIIQAKRAIQRAQVRKHFNRSK